MRLQFKPIFWLLGAILVVFTLAVVFQQYRSFSGLRQLQAQNEAVLEQREWDNANNINISAQQAVAGSLERGEMEKFTRLLADQRKVQGLLEFALFDRQGTLTHSSEAHSQQKSLPAELRDGLLRHPDPVKRLTDQAFEIYQPQMIEPDCLRCHTDWPQSGVSGVMALRFSNASLTKAKADWTATVGKLRTRQITEAGISAVLVGVCFFALTVYVVRTKIAGPLNRAIDLANHASEEIAASSNQLTVAGQSLAEGASEQAASLEETSVSLEEMSSMTRRNAENAQQAKALASQALAAADAGAVDMQSMSTAMSAIKKSGDDIAKILKTIDEIAFQTNLLALNAAVEAARAGEAGAGFAVVADEVRSLAQRAASAAKETSGKIEAAIANTAQGVAINSKVAQALADIVSKARQVDELVSEVAGASHEQSQGISQVTTAVSQMDKVTQNNAASAEESAAAAGEMNAQAGTLKDAVRELMRLVDGAQAVADEEKRQ